MDLPSNGHSRLQIVRKEDISRVCSGEIPISLEYTLVSDPLVAVLKLAADSTQAGHNS